MNKSSHTQVSIVDAGQILVLHIILRLGIVESILLPVFFQDVMKFADTELVGSAVLIRVSSYS